MEQIENKYNMVDLYSAILVILLHVNGYKTPFKWQRLSSL